MKLLIVDGNSFIYKAFYAIRGLSNAQGVPTNAVYGFHNILDKCLSVLQPDGVAIVFDTRQPTFRHKRYPQYKAQRQKAPEDLLTQIPHIHHMVQTMGYTILTMDGYEADDIIATITQHSRKQGYTEVYIATSDKDLGQLLVQPGVFLYDTSKEKILDAEGLQQKIGVAPQQVVDYLALTGDSSDNIPGVKGVGPKSAQKLMLQYGDLDAVYAHLHEIGGALHKRLQDDRENAYLSRELITLHPEVPLESWDYKPGKRDTTALGNFYREMDFRGLLERLSSENTTTTPSDNPTHSALSFSVTMLDDSHDMRALQEQLQQQQVFALDTETTSEHPMLAELVGVSLAFEETVVYLPVDHNGYENNIALPRLEALLQLMNRPEVLLVGQNLKYDLIVLEQHGISLSRPTLFDTMVASYILDANRRSHSLDQLAQEFLCHQMIPFREVVPKGATFRDVKVDTAAQYAGEDAAATLALFHKFSSSIDQSFAKLFHDIEMPLLRVLVSMEQTGIRLDLSELQRIEATLSHRLCELEERIHELAGEAFNINSPKQLASILFDKLEIPPVKKTKTGYSTDVSVLESLAQEYEIAEKLTHYRTVGKLLSTYVKSLSKLIHPRTHRIHTSFNQTIANTGRLSSSDPNLQNIPIRTEEGRQIRKAFVPKDGYFFVAADYSQIELRIAAHLSGDKGMISAFRDGLDIHARTAEAIFGSAEPNYRRMAKAVNFGILYGISAYKLSRDLGITPKEGQALIDSYFLQYQGVKVYIDQQIAFARQHGYAQTLYGRRRYLPDINSRNFNIREAAQRNAVNMPIQGTAADIIKIAMNRIAPHLQSFNARMLLQIHDELLFEVPQQEVPSFSNFLQQTMEGAASLSVHLSATVQSGINWNEVH
ncbi:DNA polymerase I [Desulfurispira natronophila]|uniref:DNA polymerase I n=1 Tax=Desulfurispira natronophila TaxID=682562 RepID=A0A7W7Y416_9BACT|nr:DNA polymerase I [Desulfurispira natronophila]MBB5021688.1 DNA polymerase-1 [Desulfurispira natronophila]